MRIYVQREGVPLLQFLYESPRRFVNRFYLREAVEPMKKEQLTFYLEVRSGEKMQRFFTLEKLLSVIDCTNPRLRSQELRRIRKRRLELLEDLKRLEEEEKEWMFIK